MSTTFNELQRTQLAPHPKNVRRDVGNVVELANSITAQGIMQPLVVAPDLTQRPDVPLESIAEFQYTIIAGHRRFAAAELANLDVLPCVIRADLNTEPKQLEAMLVENTQRTDLTITEEAEAYQSLLEFDGYTIKSVAKATGRSQNLVRSRIALTKLSEDAKVKLEERTLNIDQALVLTDFTADEAATKRLLKVADSPNEWAFQLAKEQKAKAWLENLPRLTAELQGAGVEIVDRPEGPAWQWTEWRVSYQTMTVAEAVAGDWSAICDKREPEITWLKKRPAGTTPTVQERTPEQIAEEILQQELTRGLATAAEVRTEFIKNAIQHPAADKTKAMLVDYIIQRHRLDDLAAWLDIALGEGQEEADFAKRDKGVTDAIGKLDLPQLVALMHVDQFEREMYMTDLGGWRSGPGWQSTESWRGRLGTEAEQAALAYHRAEEEATDD
ncbi:ParB/RepB/Spo0J family partition protein [Pseudarthrobacter sp. ATCC 49987]|uniref:ParB/RepB/Spo0J family partition protein n=1 Tax=Pseudarthrobacter sp. ATCC 49987 TaxID=2698204 RepID=UPI00136F010A|nr:ParB/RepB/Spo0J family partition protein [Pseudarthrobacter sp. ATCC 49987]